MPAATIYDLWDASSLNGDLLKADWSKLLTPALDSQAGVLISNIGNLVARFMGESQLFQQCIHRGDATKGSARDIVQAVRSYNFQKRIDAVIAGVLPDLLADYLVYANRAYKASVVHLIEGVHQQMKGDADFQDAKLNVRFSKSEKIVADDLVMFGLALDQLLHTRITQILSQSWLLGMLARNVAAYATYDQVSAAVLAMVKLKLKDIQKLFAQLEFAVGHFAVRKASLRLTDVKIVIR
jgi:hypothetical protein